jgi:hypothetical protein
MRNGPNGWGTSLFFGLIFYKTGTYYPIYINAPLAVRKYTPVTTHTHPFHLQVESQLRDFTVCVQQALPLFYIRLYPMAVSDLQHRASSIQHTIWRAVDRQCGVVWESVALPMEKASIGVIDRQCGVVWESGITNGKGFHWCPETITVWVETH